jgi:hypothetical protein
LRKPASAEPDHESSVGDQRRERTLAMRSNGEAEDLLMGAVSEVGGSM